MRIDALGQACPLPVIALKDALRKAQPGEAIRIAVDNAIAVQNLQKMAAQKGLACRAQEINSQHFEVTVVAEGEANRAVIDDEKSEILARNPVEFEAKQAEDLLPAGPTVLVLSSDTMGMGDEKLGHSLMKGFIFALTQQEKWPDTLLLYNRGIFLSTSSSDSIEDLCKLEAGGVEILSCGACLNFYERAEQLQVGTVTNMYEIVDRMLQAGRLIKP